MHTCRIVTASGEVYDSALVVANPLSTLLRDSPYVRILDPRGGVKDVPLDTIVSAVTEGERVTVNILGDKNELPGWKHLHRVYRENKERLDGMPEKERMNEAGVLFCQSFSKDDLGIIPSEAKQ